MFACIFSLSSAEAVYHNFLRDTMVKVDYDGQLLWASPVNFRSFCRLDVRYFPFDEQECEMKFGPWSHDGNELVINGSGGLLYLNGVRYLILGCSSFDS